MLLDTTLLIDFLRGKKEAIKVIKNAEKNYLYTTEINVFELITGINMIKPKPEKEREKLFAMLLQLTVFQLDRKSSIKAGEIAGRLIKEGKKIEATDSLIAGICLTNGVNKIITANKSHFERIKEIKVISY